MAKKTKKKDKKIVRLKYVVNKEKKTVACILLNTANDAIDMLRCDADKSKLGRIELHRWIIDEDLARLPKSFAGVAKCAPGDRFTIKKGKEIAYHKAKEKYYRALKNALVLSVKDSSLIIDDFYNRLGVRFENAVNQEGNFRFKLSELCGRNVEDVKTAADSEVKEF